VCTVLSGGVWAVAKTNWAHFAFSASASTLGACLIAFITLLHFYLTVIFLSTDVADARDGKLASIEEERQIGTFENRYYVVGHGIFGNALSVVTVESSIWRAVVGRFAELCDLPIIDVSRPSNAVLWEVEEMAKRLGGRCVIVGEAGAVRALTESTESNAVRLRRLLQGAPVYVYGTDRVASRRFARTLRAAFERHRRLPRPVAQTDGG
jgi:hypothetical protein